MAPTRRDFLSTTAAGLAALALPGSAAARSKEQRVSLLKRPIPRTGEQLPVIGLGTWQGFDVGADADALRQREEVLKILLDGGGRVIDSSPMYGRAEAVVGTLLGRMGRTKDAFVATKVWTRGTDEGIRQMRASMDKLGDQRIELMQVHNLVDWKKHLPTLRAWKNEGRVQYLGVTHYQLSELDTIERIMKTETLDFVQVPYSLGVRAAEKRVLPTAADTGTAVLIMEPFESGRLFRAVKGKALPEWARECDCASWAQVFLKFILGHPSVTCPIPGTSKPAHMRDNLGAGRGRLPDEALRKRMVRLLG